MNNIIITLIAGILFANSGFINFKKSSDDENLSELAFTNESIVTESSYRIRLVDKDDMVASWYGPRFNGRLTANGEIYNQMAFTAAHKTLPFGTMLKITNPKNDKSVIVRINDRGPYIKGRQIDLSKGAAIALGMIGRGVIKVKVEALVPELINKSSTS